MVMTAALSTEPAPVLVAVGEPTAQSRLSVLVRPLLALPHLVALVLVAPSVVVVVALGWFWALVTGRLPLFAAVILSGYLGWQTRVLGYLFLLTDVYPPFTLSDPAYPVRVTSRPGPLNRLAVLLRPLLALPAAAVAADGQRRPGHRRPGGLGHHRRHRPAPRLSPPGRRRLPPLPDPPGRLPDHGHRPSTPGACSVTPRRPTTGRRPPPSTDRSGWARPRPGNRARPRRPGIPTGGSSSRRRPRTTSFSCSSSAWPPSSA